MCSERFRTVWSLGVLCRVLGHFNVILQLLHFFLLLFLFEWHLRPMALFDHGHIGILHRLVLASFHCAQTTSSHLAQHMRLLVELMLGLLDQVAMRMFHGLGFAHHFEWHERLTTRHPHLNGPLEQTTRVNACYAIVVVQELLDLAACGPVEVLLLVR